MSRLTDFFTTVYLAATGGLTRPGQGIREDLKERYRDYTLKTIKKWRNAQMTAENEDTLDWRSLHNIYHDVMLDSHLSAQIETRINRVIGSKWTWSDQEGESDPEMDECFKRAWFEDLVRIIMNAKFYGFTVFEIEGVKDGEITGVCMIPHIHVNRKYKMVEQNVGTRTGWSWEDPRMKPWLCTIGDLRDLGLLLKATPMALYKKGAMGRWSQYTELFGHPYRVGRVQGGNDKRKLEMAKVLANMGSAAWGVFEQGEGIELVQTNHVDAQHIYDKLIARINSELSKLVTGQTMTADDGSSLSQSQVHENIFDEITEADLRYVEYFINTIFRPYLLMHGYRVEELRFNYSRETELTTKESWEIHKGMLEHYNIDKDWLSEQYNVPLEDKELPPPLAALPGSQDPKNNPPQPAPDEEDDNSMKGASCCGHYRHAIDVTMADPAIPTKYELALLKKIWRGGTVRLDTAAYLRTRQRLANGLMEGFGSISAVSYGAADAIAARAMQANIFRFGWDKNVAEIAVLNKLARKHTRFADFEKEAALTLKAYNKHYLKTEYDFTVATAQNARAWVDLKTQSNFWKYVTMGDDRVRSEHAALDGKVFSVDDTEAAKLVPPNGWRCRCTIQPVAKAEKVETIEQARRDMGQKDFARMQDDGFFYNRGDQGNIFSANQRYSADLGADIADLEAATYEAYGKKAYASLVKGRRDFEAIDATVKEIREFYKSREVADDIASFVDATGLPVFLRRDTMESNLNGVLLELDQLSKADEGYMVGDLDAGGAQYVFLTFYRNGAIRTKVKLSKEIDAEVTDVEFIEGNLVDQSRNGILIHG